MTQTYAQAPEAGVEKVAAMLIGAPVESVRRAGGGGNSRIYRADSRGASYALKMYPIIQNDTRDRLGVEKQALRFFARYGISCVPNWINDCPGFALLSWVEGELANPPLDTEIDTAVHFLADIRSLSATADARALPAASEACMSGAELCVQVTRRLEKLRGVSANEPALHDFLSLEFISAFSRAKREARAQCLAAGIAFDNSNPSHYCLIPADFGFHNVMRGSSGALTFIDFEYFGWDDPVKLTADFLLHPAMRLTPAQSKRFHAGMIQANAEDKTFAARLEALTPLFALRWALILLNEFLPERWSGRAFAQGLETWEKAKARQLVKAKAMLQREEAYA